MKIVFMGSPQFAVPTLEALIAHPEIEVCAVVTQPDKPAGRGRQLIPPAVKTCAELHNITCFQPMKLKTQEMFDVLTKISPDFFVTIAYGKILRQSFLDIPKIAPLNLHASLLPKYRGAAPVQWSIINGETETGVCLMKMDAGMDTGPVYVRETMPIAPDETPETLFEKLSHLSAKVLMDNLFLIANGELQPQPQEGIPTAAPPLEKSMGNIDLNDDAQALACKIRGLSGWPVACALYNKKRIMIHDAIALDIPANGTPGTIHDIDPETRSLCVTCGNGSMLGIKSLQLEGKKRMDAESFFNGYHPKGNVLEKI